MRSFAALLSIVLVTACASTRTPAPKPLPATTLTPWQIPQGAYGSQRLYRVAYSGPEGEGSFRVSLRLATPARYQLQAVDPVGRSLWSLDVLNDSGLWLNHRAKTYCQFEGRFDVSGVPLGPFPLLSLPSLLLGRVPAEPAAGAPGAEPRGREFDFRDPTNRRWYGTLGEEGIVLNWTLAEDSSPKVWWIRREDWSILSDRDRGIQVRWREMVRENLDQEPARLEAPAGYREVACGEQEVPEPDE